MSENTPAYELGYERGVTAGTWVIDGNTSADTIRAIAQGIKDGDPAVMDMQPAPLSGEWANDPATADVLAELGVIEDDDECFDHLLDEYENGFSDGYWSEVKRSVNFHLR